MKYDFSLASISDASEILALYHSLIGTEGCAWNVDYPNMEFVESDIRNESLYILKDGDKIIAATYAGQIDELAELSWSPKKPCELARLAVRADMQKKGIASLLLGHVKRAVKERGFDGIVMMVSKANPPAIALYDRNGFVRCGEVFMFEIDFYCYEAKI